jgi:hypothetical protein
MIEIINHPPPDWSDLPLTKGGHGAPQAIMPAHLALIAWVVEGEAPMHRPVRGDRWWNTDTDSVRDAPRWHDSPPSSAIPIETRSTVSHRLPLGEYASAHLAEFSVGYLALARDAALVAARESYVRLAVRYAVLAAEREIEEERANKFGQPGPAARPGSRWTEVARAPIPAPGRPTGESAAAV